MNHVTLVGRLTAEPDLKYSSKDTSMAIARYTLAVERRFSKKDEGQQSVDFIRCVAFKKSAEFASKYFHKGKKVAIEGRIQTGKYTNKDGIEIPTTDIIIENQEFADSPSPQVSSKEQSEAALDGFTSTVDDIEGATSEELPF